MIRSQPGQRLSIISDFYRVLLDGMSETVVILFSCFSFVSIYMDVEVLLNSRRELLVCMIKEGILHAIGDIIVSETDPLILVCLLFMLDFWYCIIHCSVNTLILIFITYCDGCRK